MQHAIYICLLGLVSPYACLLGRYWRNTVSWKGLNFKAKMLDDKLREILKKFEVLSQKLNEPGRLDHKELEKVLKEYSAVLPVATLSKEYLNLQQELKDTKVLAEDKTNELYELAVEEQKNIVKRLENLQLELKFALLPKDKDNRKNVILEIRAGTGGEEAALFAVCLFRMYQKYAEKQKWKFEILSASDTGLDGFKEVTVSISGQNVYEKLKFESGGHRVQRIPKTESSGRIHTSAATVAVLPEAEEIDVEILPGDIKIDVFRASGAGGQHVNTTDSAVRITHLPTGIVVSQQDEKSQHKNKAKALKILRARMYDMMKAKEDSKISSMRKSQVGSGDRSERIRTYNYPQSRITDHRINFSVYNLEEVINEGELSELIDALIADEKTKLLAEGCP